MIDPERRRRVLIVGAGRRVQNNFLPVLKCLEENFRICGIHARTESKLQRVAHAWDIPAVARLAEFDFSKVDVVVISVPTGQNGNVLAQLHPHAAKLDLVIDTPIAWNEVEYKATQPLLKKFRSVTVAEDYMNFPRFDLVRKVVRSGAIGELRHITLHNIGYLYHGLALIRSFVGFELATQTWKRNLGAHSSIVGYDLPGGVCATVVGPYRRHATGGILVEGSAGIITEYPIDKDFAGAGKECFILSKRLSGGFLAGFEIQGGEQRYAIDTPEIQRISQMKIEDKSELNLERACGLSRVFESLLDFRNMNRRYSFSEAFYDSFASRRAESGETPLYPFDKADLAYAETRQRTVAPPAFSWIAKSSTFLKRSTSPAAGLPPDSKLAVPIGAKLEASSADLAADHLALRGLVLNGMRVAGEPWYIFGPAWERNLN